MEALTGVSTGLLTIYDMLKAINKSMVIENIRQRKKVEENRVILDENSNQKPKIEYPCSWGFKLIGRDEM